MGTDRDLAGKRYVVIDASGATVQVALHRAAITPKPWGHAYPRLAPIRGPLPGARTGARPDLTVVDGSIGGLRAMRSPRSSSSSPGTPSGQRIAVPRAVHLNDAAVTSGPLAGKQIDMTGGWMDAGDMIHFTQTTVFAAAMLEAARGSTPLPRRRSRLEADVGIRWLLKAHPAPGLFIAQVGDERDHEHGFRDPAADDSASPAPADGGPIRIPRGGVGGDIAARPQAALALAYLRTGPPSLSQRT